MGVFTFNVHAAIDHFHAAKNSIIVLRQCCDPPFVVQLFILFWVQIGYNLRLSTRIQFLVEQLVRDIVVQKFLAYFNLKKWKIGLKLADCSIAGVH
jgi:hypothetical protein